MCGVCGKVTVCLVMGWNILKPRGFRAAPLVATANKASYCVTRPCVRPHMGTDQRGMATSERQRRATKASLHPGTWPPGPDQWQPWHLSWGNPQTSRQAGEVGRKGLREVFPHQPSIQQDSRGSARGTPNHCDAGEPPQATPGKCSEVGGRRRAAPGGRRHVKLQAATATKASPEVG